MADTSFAADSAVFAAALAERSRLDGAARQRLYRRGTAVALVLLLHLLAILALMHWMLPNMARPKRQAEHVTWLILKPLPHANPVKPKKLIEKEGPAFIYNGITLPELPPPKANVTDQALAIGRAIACGAGSFEYLMPSEQQRCRRTPWHYKHDKDGTLVMDVEKAKPDLPEFTIGDIQARQRMEPPPCPPLSVTPCVAKVLHPDPALP